MQITDFKALTFDCYGTLIDWESGMFTALQPLVARARKPLSRDEVLAAHGRHESSQQLVTPAMPYSRLLAMVYKRLAEEWGVPASFEAQAEACFGNLLAILEAAGMGPADLVRLDTYLVDPDDCAAYMAARDRHVTAPPPASTLLVVRALAAPQFKIEIEAVAAQIM